MRTQRFGRLATVGADQQPHVVPVTFRYNQAEDSIEIGGHAFVKGKKWRDVGINPRVAFVVDDMLVSGGGTGRPWKMRGIEIRGKAERVPVGGKEIVPTFDDEMFRIRPFRVRSWGLAD